MLSHLTKNKVTYNYNCDSSRLSTDSATSPGQNATGQNAPGQNATRQNAPGQNAPDKITQTVEFVFLFFKCCFSLLLHALNVAANCGKRRKIELNIIS